MSEEYITKKEFEEFADGLDERVALRFQKLEEHVGTQEQLLAEMVVAYTELASAVESLTAEVMSPRTEEERDAFRKKVDERHLETLKVIQGVGRDVARSRDDSASESILNMVERKQTHRQNQQRHSDNQDDA